MLTMTSFLCSIGHPLPVTGFTTTICYMSIGTRIPRTTETDSPFPGLQLLGIRGANDGGYKGKEDEICLQLHVMVRQVIGAARVGGEWGVDWRLYIVQRLPFGYASFLCYALIFDRRLTAIASCSSDVFWRFLARHIRRIDTFLGQQGS
ncbi:hypothetical protein F5146DRAFT_165621 [Armillaria mellea]|nr:hypothetical protein F5146DRAFT_165621 [Armillaria mellea]